MIIHTVRKKSFDFDLKYSIVVKKAMANNNMVVHAQLVQAALANTEDPDIPPLMCVGCGLYCSYGGADWAHVCTAGHVCTCGDEVGDAHATEGRCVGAPEGP